MLFLVGEQPPWCPHSIQYSVEIFRKSVVIHIVVEVQLARVAEVGHWGKVLISEGSTDTRNGYICESNSEVHGCILPRCSTAVIVL